MSKTEKTERVKIEVIPDSKGNFVMRKTTYNTTYKVVVMPFVWPSRESAMKDLDLIVKGLQLKGYTLVDADGKEVERSA